MKTILTTISFLVASAMTTHAQVLTTEKVYSTKMNKEIETVIITPDIQNGKTYKSIYILHGYSGNPTRTYQQDIPNLKQLAQKNSTIYILANGNYNSWYIDSPIQTDSQYQTFIGDELVDYIDTHFPTIKDKKNRGIVGWSMGGYGAIHIGSQYPDTFSVIGSSCGALDFNLFENGYQNYQVDRVLGDLNTVPLRYFTTSRINRIAAARQMLILDCGTEDEQMIQMNRTIHHELTTQNIDHLYMESPGAHTPAYWSKALNNQLTLFENYLRDERP